MKIDFYEKVFLGLTVVMLVAFGIFLMFAVQAHDITVASPAGRVDPATMLDEAPWNEPGVVKTAEGEYLATYVARTWNFDPAEITVPVGANITFQVVTRDIIHGFYMPGTNVNIMVIPGEISVTSHKFDEPGEYLILCHEYCGASHQTMHAKIIVESASGDDADGSDASDGGGS
jgi:cytochrome c oxidase subunit 2